MPDLRAADWINIPKSISHFKETHMQCFMRKKTMETKNYEK